MSTLKVGTIQDHANGNTAITIDSAGRVLTPARPAFRGTRTYTTTDFSGTGLDITGYTEDFDIGGAFDASAGTYTVPLTGIYQINITQDAAQIQAATNTFLRLKIDGVMDNSTRILRQDPEGGQSSSSTFCQTLSLTANQVLLVHFLTGTDTSILANFVFSGFLVG